MINEIECIISLAKILFKNNNTDVDSTETFNFIKPEELTISNNDISCQNIDFQFTLIWLICLKFVSIFQALSPKYGRIQFITFELLFSDLAPCVWWKSVWCMAMISVIIYLFSDHCHVTIQFRVKWKENSVHVTIGLVTMYKKLSVKKRFVHNH